MTEWNMRGDDDPVRGTWANTLFTTVFYHTFLESDVVTMTHYHNLVGTLFPAVLTDSIGYQHVKARTVPTRPWAVSAGGLAGMLFGKAMTGRTEATRLTFNDLPVLENDGMAYPALAGWLFGEGVRPQTGVLLNLSGDTQRLDVSAMTALRAASYRQYSAALDTYVVGTDGLYVEDGVVSDILTVPPYAVLVLTL